jgi:hypothetical protein
MKRLLVCLVLLLSARVAQAAEQCALFPAEIIQAYSAPAGAIEKAVLKNAKAHRSVRAITVTASGSLYFQGSNCGTPSSTVINTRLLVTQKGVSFSVRIPGGQVLRGRGGRGGFRVTTKFVASNGVMVFEELSAGPVKGGRAQFRLSFSSGPCVMVFAGPLAVY